MIRAIVSAPIHAYRLLISPLLGPACRFSPSCSAYALEAIAVHGPLQGPMLALRRLARCHPWGGAGFDPVPPLAATDLDRTPTLPTRGLTDGTPR